MPRRAASRIENESRSWPRAKGESVMTRQRFAIAFAAGVAGLVLSGLPRVFAADFKIVKPDEVQYSPNPAGSGPDIAVIAGDPTKAEFYIIRARFTPGVMSRPHSHPTDRHVTVIAGTWWAGTGKTFDPSKTTPLGPGSYMLHPANEAHFDGSKEGEVIVEIKGIGPAPSVPVTP
jgi:quercetin dioxygenase-like cupin family protein